MFKDKKIQESKNFKISKLDEINVNSIKIN